LTLASANPIRLAARGVGFEYSRSAKILDGWDADFEAGTITALTGASGRGKSTLLYLLGLMLSPSSGEISVGGIPTSNLKDSFKARLRADLFGFVFQDAALDTTRTILDNVTEVALYRGENRNVAATRARELLARFEVEVPADRKPGQVSGGQAQRIALCRALLSSPRILLADEPTGNLDPESSRIVVDAMVEQARSGAAVIVVTHSPAVAAACDREIRL
jgi:ABC-type lipoprotein export system ATPase subunit